MLKTAANELIYIGYFNKKIKGKDVKCNEMFEDLSD